MYTETQCRDLVERVVRLSKADEVHVSLNFDEVVHQRFARNCPSTAGLVSSVTVSVRSTFGTRTATSQGNQFSGGALEDIVRSSEELARAGPEDPEFQPALGEQVFVEVPEGAPESEAERLEHLTQGIALVIGRALRSGYVAAGFAQARDSVRCIANAAGLFGYQRTSDAHFAETVRTPDGAGSGWASTASIRARDLDFEGPTTTAISKARGSLNARTFAPGDYPAVLEPACVASLMGLLMGSMDMRQADEGRSFFSLPEGQTRLGEKLFPESISLHSDPADPTVPALRWSADGVPHAPTSWIDKGVLANLHCNRYWGREHSRPLLPRPPNTLLRGGNETLAELIAGTERGLLVTNLWYMRGVDTKTMLYTGLTRDGLFWIEDGKVTHPVNNFRWNDSPIRVLQNTEALSRPMRIGGRNGRTLSALVPALRVKSFGFTSISDAV